MTIITRFAPSPTGELHVGNLRTAIIAYIVAKKNNGKFILRIDDTDLKRSTVEFEKQIEEDLIECGLIWDSKFKQSEKSERYNQVKEQLIKSGRIYDCYETQEELDIARKVSMKNNKPFVYDRKALKLTEEEKKQLISEGRQPYWRFKLDENQTISWDDKIKGELNFNPKLLSDPVVIRADGTFTYLLISVIDDIDSDVNYIIRGEDHISNTASQVQMWIAMNSEVPEFAHLALMKMPEGKISKRIGGFEIRELLNEGIMPITIINYLSKLGSSQNIGDFHMDFEELISNFDIENCSSSSPNFNKKELQDLNMKIADKMHFSNIEKFLKHKLKIEVNEELWDIIKCNISNFSEINYWNNICNKGPEKYDFEMKDQMCKISKLALKYLPIEELNLDSWTNIVNAIAKDNSDISKKEIFMGLRKIITGFDHGPEMKRLLPLIGLKNLKTILEKFN